MSGHPGSLSVLGALWVLGALGCSADHHAERGRDALQAHALPEAEAAFRKSLERDPQHEGALAGLGWTYHLAGERNAARVAFARCAELHPRSAECLRGQASVALSTGDTRGAGALLKSALELNPTDLKVQSSQALLDTAMGDLTTAAERYERLIQQAPEQAEYQMGLAEVRLLQNQPEAALEIVDRALAIEGSPHRYLAGLWVQRARALIMHSGGREDANDCGSTAAPVRAWLAVAAEALDNAEALDVQVPDLPGARRQLSRRRSVLDETCPP